MNAAQRQKFILKLFPEIMIKGSSVKRKMVGQLYANLVKLLQPIDADIAVKKFSDKLEVFAPTAYLPEVRQRLLDTPGIEKILEVRQFDGIDTLDAIKEKTGRVVADSLAGKTFAVRAKRSGTHAFTSIDIERGVGGYLLAHSDAKGVRLKNPDVTVRLEYVDRQLNIVTASYPGLSGFPLGTQGDVLSLMSGGFDSTVASYLSIKRGIKTHFVFFNLGGDAHEIGVKQVALYLWSRFAASHRVQFVTVDFEPVLAEIFRTVPPSYMGVMLKRLMLAAAERVAEKLGIDALVTGESVAQVSSQTLRNLALIDQATGKLVLRPLAMMNKPEIIAIAESIGTRRFAESMPEYCGVISQNPVTHGSFSRLERVARNFDDAVLHRAADAAQYLDIDAVAEDIGTHTAVETVSDLSADDYTVIDIRATDTPIETDAETLNIPFYELKKAFKTLPKDKKYLLYCDKGIMSRLHAQYLKDAGICEDIKIYRP